MQIATICAKIWEPGVGAYTYRVGALRDSLQVRVPIAKLPMLKCDASGRWWFQVEKRGLTRFQQRAPLAKPPSQSAIPPGTGFLWKSARKSAGNSVVL